MQLVNREKRGNRLETSFIQCLGCGKMIPLSEVANHSRTCQSRRSEGVALENTFQKWLDSLPPLPIHPADCDCEICKGYGKECPDCKIKSMYLDRDRRAWRCIKCNRHEAVIDPTKPHKGE